MRIEILLGGSEQPMIFALNRPKLTIGSSDASDIVINADGVSRKHVTVVTEGDSFFVIDQGSTNGTYINEERLVPGRRAEFTSFFPVRLGDNVLLTLLSDDDDTLSEPISIPFPKSEPKERIAEPESTRVISLKDLKATKTQTLVKKRDQVVTKKTAAKQSAPVKKNPESSRMNLVKAISASIILVALYLNFFREKEPEPVVYEVGQVVNVAPTEKVAALPVTPPSPLIAQEDIIPRERLQVLQDEMKCVTDYEKYLCDLLEADDGVVQSGSSLIVFMSAKPFRDLTLSYMHPIPEAATTPEEIEIRNQLLKDQAELTGALAIRGLPETLDAEKLKDFKIVLVLKDDSAEGKSINGVVAFKATALPDFRKYVLEDHFMNYLKIGISTLTYPKTFYRFY